MRDLVWRAVAVWGAWDLAGRLVGWVERLRDDEDRHGMVRHGHALRALRRVHRRCLARPHHRRELDYG